MKGLERSQWKRGEKIRGHNVLRFVLSAVVQMIFVPSQYAASTLFISGSLPRGVAQCSTDPLLSTCCVPCLRLMFCTVSTASMLAAHHDEIHTCEEKGSSADAIAITGYTIFINIAVSGSGNQGWNIAHGPLSIVFGIFAGLVASLIASPTKLWNNAYKRTCVVVILGERPSAHLRDCVIWNKSGTKRRFFAVHRQD